MRSGLVWVALSALSAGSGETDLELSLLGRIGPSLRVEMSLRVHDGEVEGSYRQVGDAEQTALGGTLSEGTLQLHELANGDETGRCVLRRVARGSAVDGWVGVADSASPHTATFSR